MPRDSTGRGRYWYDEELSTPVPFADIDVALDAFDRSKWKERVNKVLIAEQEAQTDYNEHPLNRFR